MKILSKIFGGLALCWASYLSTLEHNKVASVALLAVGIGLIVYGSVLLVRAIINKAEH